MIWAPKPLKPTYNLPTNEEYKIKKSYTPMEEQRRRDGSPMTVTRPWDLKPRDKKIIIKGSLAEKLPPATYKTDTDPPSFCPHDFSELVKNYLNR